MGGSLAVPLQYHDLTSLADEGGTTTDTAVYKTQHLCMSYRSTACKSFQSSCGRRECVTPQICTVSITVLLCVE